MSVKMRQEIERKIAIALIESALKAGFAITVNDGEEDVLKDSISKHAVLKSMFTTDDDTLYLRKPGATKYSWVKFVYGNDGYDVISDYTIDLEPIMSAADEISEQYS